MPPVLSKAISFIMPPSCLWRKKGHKLHRTWGSGFWCSHAPVCLSFEESWGHLNSFLRMWSPDMFTYLQPWLCCSQGNRGHTAWKVRVWLKLTLNSKRNWIWGINLICFHVCRQCSQMKQIFLDIHWTFASILIPKISSSISCHLRKLLYFITFRPVCVYEVYYLLHLDPRKYLEMDGKHAANLFCKQNLPVLELEITWLKMTTMNSFTFNFMELINMNLGQKSLAKDLEKLLWILKAPQCQEENWYPGKFHQASFSLPPPIFSKQ